MEAMSIDRKFLRWLAKVDRIGQREHIFDKPGVRFLCPGSKARRPYFREDGAFYELWASGCPPEFAIGEALAMESW